MSIWKIVFVMVSVFLFISCDKECKCPDKVLQYPELYQTYWEGTLAQKRQGKESIYQIKISFEFENRGDYIIMNSQDIIYSSIEGFFQYKLDNKILYITEGGYENILNGNWLIVSFDRDNIVLQESVINEMNSSKLSITKIY